VLVIGISADYYRKIYVWETTVGNDVVLLANSFNEFLDMLYNDKE
jgi:hypothetical protein